MNSTKQQKKLLLSFMMQIWENLKKKDSSNKNQKVSIKMQIIYYLLHKYILY